MRTTTWAFGAVVVFVTGAGCLHEHDSDESLGESAQGLRAELQDRAIGGSSAVSGGLSHTCAVAGNGKVQCWGSNAAGQLGDGTHTEQLSPATVLTGPFNLQNPAGNRLAGGIAVAAGATHSCALLADGTVWCWGANASGQIGDGTTNERVYAAAVSGVKDAVAVAGGHNHSCAVIGTGAVRCWGANESGQIGDGTTTKRLKSHLVSGLTDATAVAAGGSHTCAVRSTGDVVCWGKNDKGQLGDGTVAQRLTPVPVPGLGAVVSITAGADHTCASDAGGEVFCWGNNAQGQLGGGSAAPSSSVPVLAPLTEDVVHVSAGASHTCALSFNRVFCWGSDKEQQTGRGPAPPAVAAPAPAPVKQAAAGGPVTMVGAAAIGMGHQHGCARSAGSLRCWGNDAAGQLGDGVKNVTSSTAVVVAGFTAPGRIRVSLGRKHSCATRSDGTMKCWGNSAYSQLGFMGTGSGATANVKAMDMGDDFGCAIAGLDSFTAVCWGRNDRGQSGHPFSDSPTPTAVLAEVVAVGAGSKHACAVLGDGSVRCWGANDLLELGGTAANQSSTPVVVPNIEGAKAVVATEQESCALLANGVVGCWGEALYFGGSSGSAGGHAPVEGAEPPVSPMPLPDPAIAISGGGEHLCALLDTGAVWCWGSNDRGQLGDGTLDSRWVPSMVSGLPTSVAIAAGGEHTCALGSDGNVRCWGDDTKGQVGNGNVWNPGMFATPQLVAGLPRKAAGIAAGVKHSMAVLQDGTLHAWGENDAGQLGDGALVDRTSPVAVTAFP